MGKRAGGGRINNERWSVTDSIRSQSEELRNYFILPRWSRGNGRWGRRAKFVIYLPGQLTVFSSFNDQVGG